MKNLASKAVIVVLMVAAAGSAYMFRGVWLSYLRGGPGTAEVEVPDQTPAGTRDDPFIGHGVIEEVRLEEGQIVLRHGEIRGLMRAMTMGFPAAEDLSLESLAVGEEVEFRIERRDTETGPVHEVFSVEPGMGQMTAGMTMGADDGQAVFRVDPGRQQLIGVRTSPVRYETIDRTLRTIGTVALDETRISEVHPRVSGWIEETFVDFQYQHVAQGDPLFTLYSPELVATQEEYLLALRGLDTLGTSSFPSARLGAEDLVRAARRRLELWDITLDQITRLEETREPVRAMTIHSPVTGHVMERNAFSGQRVGPETMLYQIADHSVVWVRGDVYENDMAWVEAGQTAVMRVPALPGREFTGRLTFIDPHVDSRTRTLSVRLEFANPDLVLKPGMYADVEIGTSLGRRLMVPESAVLPTGVRNVVFVDRGEGRMEIRNVELGARVGDGYEVLAGVEEGERVVTSGNFLIDAESRLQAAEPIWQGEEQP